MDLDDDLNAPLATDNLPPRDEAGRFTSTEASDGDVPQDTATEPAAAPATEVPTDTAEAGVDAPEPVSQAGDVAAPELPADGEAPPSADADEKLKNQKVPYARFKEAVTKEREKRQALEQELTQLRERVAAAPQVDISEEELNALGDALIEGKTADFAKGMKAALEKMFLKGVETATERARDVTRIETAEERVARERSEAATKWQAEYPVFDPQSPDFDEDLLMEAVALRDAYESQGFSPAAAIERAVRRLAPVKEAPAPAPAAKPRPSTVAQKLAVAESQPPLPAASREVDKPVSLLSRIAEMTDEEFDKLPEAEVEKLRRGIKL